MTARGFVDQFTTPWLSACEALAAALDWVSDINALNGDERAQAVRMANHCLDRAEAFFDVLVDAAATPHGQESCDAFEKTRQALEQMFAFVRAGAPITERFRHVPVRDALQRWHVRERERETSRLYRAA